MNHCNSNRQYCKSLVYQSKWFGVYALSKWFGVYALRWVFVQHLSIIAYLNQSVVSTPNKPIYKSWFVYCIKIAWECLVSPATLEINCRWQILLFHKLYCLFAFVFFSLLRVFNIVCYVIYLTNNICLYCNILEKTYTQPYLYQFISV